MFSVPVRSTISVRRLLEVERKETSLHGKSSNTKSPSPR